MNTPNFFADAETDYKNTDYIIFSIPYDKTSSFRKGSNKAPQSIRNSSWNFEPYNLKTDVDLKNIPLHDYGDINVTNDDKPEEMIKKIKIFTQKIFNKNKFPIAIGGEHSITSGIVETLPQDTAVLFLDAHLDFRDIYQGSCYNHACVVRRAVEKVGIENVAVLGVRSTGKEELEYAKKKNLFYRDAFHIRENSLDFCLKEIEDFFGDKKLYLSIDMDFFDPCFAPGVTNPEPFGASSFDFLDILDVFSKRLIGFDVTEVCPSYDNGVTSILAAKIIRLLIGSKHNGQD
ncbi:MAG: agmatinase [Candidatus Thermoplasmatota archaeon]